MEIRKWLHFGPREDQPPPAPRESRRIILAKQLWEPQRDATYTPIAATDLAPGDHVLVEAGDLIPCDGEVIAGEASLEEGETPVIHEPSERDAVVRGARLRSGWLIVRVTDPAHPCERP
jgi:K+-transporting ATPase ATPase B chain